MYEKPFAGFVGKAEVTPVPNQFFTMVLPRIEDIDELKTVLHILWLLSRRRGYPRFVAREELLADSVLMNGITKGVGQGEETLTRALTLAVEHGILLHLEIQRGGKLEDVYLINAETERNLVAKVERGEVQSPDFMVRKVKTGDAFLQPNIFALYEQNIGILTPMIVEELKEAEKLYPHDWIESAFREAVRLNKRSWKYVARILERWTTEGKFNGKPKRDSEKESDSAKYVRGKYGHMVRR
ncbi:MAG: DnaD domain protein [Chloroflexi bacterium]|nr:DnaD domain protein [Chloroflexota bacterium]MBM4451321.1 DnaD domain protein [Chloroflexota bacterium]MBM4453534.1 DnaD domain protein [Chloroflexota bacterium]